MTTIKQAQIAIPNLVNYCWKDEQKNFEESFEVEIDFQSKNHIDQMIAIAEQNPLMSNHVFFHIMVLKSFYYSLFN